VTRRFAIAALVCALASTAAGQGVTEQELQQAQARAAIDELEALGARRPVTSWTDDAWRTAAQLAERANDLDRARRALAHVVETATDERERTRARNDLARLTAITGDAGQWTSVAARHAELSVSIRSNRGDPAPALRDLEALLEENPGYPGASAVSLAIAAGWERDGEAARALVWLHTAIERAATPADRTRAQAELVRALTRLDDLDAARAALAPIRDAALTRDLAERIERAERRHLVRRVLGALVVALVALGVATLRRRAGSWRGALGRLRRPPGEALFYLPIAALLVAVSQTGNPLVARAVLAIGAAGAAVAWLSGALLAGLRLRLGALLVHAACVVALMGAVGYLVVDHMRMLDLVLETWRGGPALR